MKSKPHAYLVAAGIFLVVVVLYDLNIGGNARFYTRWAECGGKPVGTKGSGFLNAGANYYYEPSSLPGVHASIEYFCTPLEAEEAGYSANPDHYEFPYLNAEQ